MRHVAISALCVLFLACNKKEEQAGVQVLVNYTASFKKGCFVVQVLDAANQELDRHELTELENKESPLKFAVLRREGWPEKVQFIVTAREQKCDGAQVDNGTEELDLSGTGVQTQKTLTLVTPDADGDGFVPTANGGTDCNDGSNAARPDRTDEACDGLDNNCNGQLDEGLSPRTEFFVDGDKDGVGAGAPVLACAAPPTLVATGGDCDDTNPDRAPNKQEQCNEVDDDCDGATDEGFNKEWYGDGDSDTFGAQSKLRLSCADQVAGHVRVIGNNFDCDDGDAEVKPGAVEKCNNRDDNCVGGADETFLTGAQPKGGSCLNDTCGGIYVCDTSNDTQTACNAQPPTLYYPDVDDDEQGASDGVAQKVCANDPIPTDKVANALDCDDADNGTKSMGMEVCDAIDNNCNGQLDEGLTCGGVLGRLGRVYDSATGGDGHDWRTVAVHPTAGYPLWVAGLGGKLVRKAAAATAFENHSFGETPPTSTHCGDWDWYAAWVRPSDGHVFLGGEGGRVAEHTGTACINSEDAPGGGNVTSMVGFEVNGVTTLYLANTDARLSTWVPGSPPVQQRDAGGAYYAIHAVDPNLLLVAGTVGGGAGTQSIVEYANGVLGTDVAHTLGSTVSGGVNALWMGSSNLAYAVGDGGALWRWNGTQGWNLQPAAPGTAVSFSSVVTPPGLDVIYVVDKGSPGRLRRKTQFGWARAPVITPADQADPPNVDKPLYDIAMTSVGEFWMVGDDGRVYHYPQ
ncbi:putative metal-binding motif-containing protein [Pyxidicoccus trucidator]|uniref:putative metal-binding motif-containing protein n=1 Tax=Pyxidicoccus trucidator TaxID=2709662 RepID=UPI0013D9327D|nr:putative metal-binding motif-containing protein [Pyxidicoccus trucidator]